MGNAEVSYHVPSIQSSTFSNTPGQATGVSQGRRQTTVWFSAMATAEWPVCLLCCFQVGGGSWRTRRENQADTQGEHANCSQKGPIEPKAFFLRGDGANHCTNHRTHLHITPYNTCFYSNNLVQQQGGKKPRLLQSQHFLFHVNWLLLTTRR